MTSAIGVETSAAESGILGRRISHRETDDAYPCIAKITPTLRVINCKDDMQWIVQVLQGDQWRGVSFCRTRDALIRDVRRKLGASDPFHILQRLPAHHDEVMA